MPPKKKHHQSTRLLDGASSEIQGDLLFLSDVILASEQLEPHKRNIEQREIARFVFGLNQREDWANALDRWMDRALGHTDNESRAVVDFLARLASTSVTERLQPTDAEIVERFERGGFVTMPPKLKDMILDESRETVPIRYDRRSWITPASERTNEIGKIIYQTDERKALGQLYSFLSDFERVAVSHRDKAGFRLGVQTARSIKENLTYIGNKEFMEGCNGLAALWKSFLDAHPDNQLCIISSAASLPQYDRSIVKSDEYLRSQVMSRIGQNTENDGLLSRIVTNPLDLTASQEHVKIIVIDDWIISGGTMRKELKSIYPQLKTKHGDYRSRIEIHVLAASSDAIDKGLDFEYGTRNMRVPVKSYFKAYAADPAVSEYLGFHISGSHSTVNFGFAPQLENIAKLRNGLRSKYQPEINCPALASVYRPYWPK